MLLFANQAQTTLAVPITSTATTLTVASGTGQYFPNPAAGEIFKVTLINSTNNLVTEICNCTARAGDVLTVQRGQEGTIAQAWKFSDFVTNLVTAGTLQSFSQVSGWSGYSGISGYSGFSGIGDSGYSGYSGYSGLDGQSGYSGFSGIDGQSGYSGSGISGYSGFSGYSGISGFSG